MAGRRKVTGHVVSGAAVVLATKSKSERYLYRGAPVIADEFDDESVKHAIAVGLVSEVYDEPTEDQVAAEKAAADAKVAAEKKAADDKAAAEKAAADKAEADKAASPTK